MIYRFYTQERIDEDKPVAPKSLDVEARSVDIIIGSDKAIREYDPNTDEYWDTVILPEGIEVPSNRQVPLADCHNKSSVQNILGSVHKMRAEGNLFIGKAFFSDDAQSERAFNMVSRGHLTDWSIGARVLEFTYIDEGEEFSINDRTYIGPKKIVTKSRIIEVSTCPIGADDNAKNRNDNNKELIMSKTQEKNAPIEPESNVAKGQGLELESYRSQAQAEAIELERARSAEVQSICRDADLGEDFYNEVKDLDANEVRQRAFSEMVKKSKKVENVNSVNVEVGRTAEDKYRSGIQDALLLRMGLLDKDAGSERVKCAEAHRGYSLTEIARTFLEQKGLDKGGEPEVMIGRALSSTDFPLVLGNLGNKSMLEAFDSMDETYTQWADDSGSLSNFHLHNKVRAGELGDLKEIKENETTTYQTRSEQGETVQLRSYSSGYKLTRKSIINDDLSELTDAFTEFGLATRRLSGDLAYSILTANGNMGDGNPLFDATHSNTITGAISETSIGEAIAKMKLQKDIGGKRRLNIMPQFLLTSVKNEASAEVFFNSQMFASSSTDATRNNIYYKRFTRIYDPRLDDAESGNPWYLLTRKGMTVKLFYLNGRKEPRLSSEVEFDTEGVKWRVATDVGAMAVRWEGMLKSSGV